MTLLLDDFVVEVENIMVVDTKEVVKGAQMNGKDMGTVMLTINLRVTTIVVNHMFKDRVMIW